MSTLLDTIDSTPARSHPGGHDGGRRAGRRLGDAFARIASALRTARRERRARIRSQLAFEALHALDDQTLADIGLHRDQVMPFAYAARAHGWRSAFEPRG